MAASSVGALAAPLQENSPPCPDLHPSPGKAEEERSRARSETPGARTSGKNAVRRCQLFPGQGRPSVLSAWRALSYARALPTLPPRAGSRRGEDLLCTFVPHCWLGYVSDADGGPGTAGRLALAWLSTWAARTLGSSAPRGKVRG